MIHHFYDDESVKQTIAADGYFHRGAFSVDHQGITNVFLWDDCPLSGYILLVWHCYVFIQFLLTCELSRHFLVALHDRVVYK